MITITLPSTKSEVTTSLRDAVTKSRWALARVLNATAERSNRVAATLIRDLPRSDSVTK